MTILSDGAIRARLNAGDLRLDPFDPAMIQPASIDVRLGSDFVAFDGLSRLRGPYTVDPYEDNSEVTRAFTVPDGDALVIEPGEFLLGTTVETITVPHDLVCRVEGKSSIARWGVIVHTTAGFVDPGFEGQVTLEFANLGRFPFRLWPGMKIAQFSFAFMDAAALIPYGDPRLGSKYHGQRGTTASRYHGNTRPPAPVRT
jgi:dCTP deaminase